MPEKAEVQILVDQLQKTYAHQDLQNIEIVGGRYLKNTPKKFHQLIFPMHNVNFNCKGKFIYWEFNEEEALFITLGMTASFGSRTKHSAIKFTFDTGEVYFNDIRNFGTFKIADRIDLFKKLNLLGWDILKENIPNDLIKRVRKYNNKTVAEVLMNQSISSGIGNYIKSESCYRAKILPMRLIQDLSDEEMLTLYQKAVEVVNLAYEAGGATIKDFKDLNGNSGKFFDQFQIYGKKTNPLGNPITKITLNDKRTSFYVEGIQL